MKHITRWLAVLAGWTDEVLYGRELARIRWHRADIDRICAGRQSAGTAAGGQAPGPSGAGRAEADR